MEILDFFEPVDLSQLDKPEAFEEASWRHVIDFYTGEPPVLEDKKIALIGIQDKKGETTANTIRNYLYKLKRAELAEHIIDLGNFTFSYAEKDYESLGFVLSELLNNNLFPVIINGRQEISYAQYLAFTYMKRYVNAVIFDSRLDFDLKENTNIDGRNFLQKILLHEPAYLFNLSLIGYQSHFTDTTILEFLEKMNFDLHRLGDARASIQGMEPAVRNAHFASWDLAAIRQGDAPGAISPSPNGLSGEEACLLTRYAGLSNTVSCVGFYNYEPKTDREGQTANLCAQMIWYYVEGFLNRYHESPMENREDFMKFITSIQNNAYQIVFYKSKRTDRWWMEVPIGDASFSGSTHVIPCSYEDYLAATREEIPDRWMQALKKLS